MSTLLKTQKRNAKKAEEKAKGKRKADDMEVDDDQPSAPQTKRLRNKQRVLLLSSRGINHRMRHFMNDIEVLLPHTKKGTRSLRTVMLWQSTHPCRRLKVRLEEPPKPAPGTGRPQQLQQCAVL